ncbi:MAG: tetratricopeptide repeat protein [Bacteroidota bacterium]
MAAKNLNKQFFSYLATYLVGSWSLIQFVEWFCKRYDFDSGWTDVIGFGVILLLPSAILFSWLHADEDNQFKKQKLFYLLNIGLLFTILIPLQEVFAGAVTTQKLEITDENGVKKEVEVSKQKYIRQIAFLPFQNDDNEAWLAYAFPNLIAVDINQCNRFNVNAPSSFITRLREMDYEIKDVIPQNVKEELTNYFADYVVSGSINTVKEQTYTYEIALFSQKKAKTLLTAKGQTNDIYALTDSLSVVLAQAIFQKDLKIKFDDYKNIPTKELFSANHAALKYYFSADFAFDIDNYENARQHIEKAIALDKKFVEAYNLRGAIYVRDGKIEEGRADYTKALQLSGSVSDYQQRKIKSNYYWNLNDWDKTQDFLEMWIKIHPEDDSPFFRLINLHLRNRAYDKAIEVGLAAEKAGHESVFLMRLTFLYAQTNNKEKVAEYLQRYQKEFPNDDKIERTIGGIYFEQREYEEALKHYEAYNTLDPLDIHNITYIANCLFNLGRYDQSIELLESLPPKAKNYGDSLRIYFVKEYQYEGTGQIKKAIATMNERLKFSDKHMQLMEKLERSTNDFLRLNYLIGDTSHAVKKLTEIAAVSKEYEVFARANYYIYSENGEKMEELMEEKRSFLEKVSSDDFFQMMEGIALKFKGDCAAAIPIFEEKISKIKDDEFEFSLYECYQATEQYEKAIEGFEKLLIKHPFNGEWLLRYAQCLNENGQVEQAKAELDKLMKLWENADSEYIRYQEALAFSEQLNLLN